MTYEELKKEADKLGYSLIKNQPYVRFRTCICGRNRRELWFCQDQKTGEHYKRFMCACGRYADGKSEKEAKLNWNKMIEEELENVDSECTSTNI